MRIRQADFFTCGTGYPILMEQSNITKCKPYDECYQKRKHNTCLPHNQTNSPKRLLPLRESITEYYNRQLGIGVQHVGYLHNEPDFNYTKIHKNRYNEQIKDNQTTNNWRNCLIKKTQQPQKQKTYRSARATAQLSEQSSPSTLEDEQNAF